jgi:hypothetical protein
LIKNVDPLDEASILTPDVLGMQSRLYNLGARRRAPVADVDMMRALRRLREHPDLAPFRLWLVGSRVEPGREQSDIDVVLSPRTGGDPVDAAINAALWRCREAGLNDSDPPCVIDPCFRSEGPSLNPVPLRPGALLRSVKLISPRLVRLMQLGRLAGCRRVGHLSLAFARSASETSFYAKLPRRCFDADAEPYLRPALEIADADGDSGGS